MDCEIKQYLSFRDSSANAPGIMSRVERVESYRGLRRITGRMGRIGDAEPLGCLTPGLTARCRRNAGEGRASSRPLSDGRMSGCPVVPMVDDPMTARCLGNAALHLATPGDAGILPAADARKRDQRWGELSERAASPIARVCKCVNVQMCKCPVSSNNTDSGAFIICY